MNENENLDLNSTEDIEENEDVIEDEFDDDTITRETEEIRKDYGEEPDFQEKNLLKSIYEWVDSFLISLIVVILIFTFFVGKVRVDGDSMNDTLFNDNQLLITNFNYTPKNGDIVIVSRNATNYMADQTESKEPIVKRVIAVEGQTIEIKNGFVYVNDKKLDETYIKDYDIGNDTQEIDLLGKQTVPEGRIFVMGDNRDNSHDSRMKDIYFVDKRYVLGKVLCRIYPFDSIRGFN